MFGIFGQKIEYFSCEKNICSFCDLNFWNICFYLVKPFAISSVRYTKTLIIFKWIKCNFTQIKREKAIVINFHIWFFRQKNKNFIKFFSFIKLNINTICINTNQQTNYFIFKLFIRAMKYSLINIEYTTILINLF